MSKNSELLMLLNLRDQQLKIIVCVCVCVSLCVYVCMYHGNHKPKIYSKYTHTKEK